MSAKLSELEQTLKLAQAGRSEVALQVMGTDVGQQSMDRIRSGIAALQARERERTYALVEEWRSSLQLSRAGVAAITALNIVLLVLIMRWMKQDWLRARDREQELDRLVQERTSQLANLASYLHEVSETEKTRLGRELHDELGATLTAVKMDVAWTRGKLAPGQGALAEKLERAARNLDMCIQVKRRIIEDLRPTTLANFGLMTAARELAEQTAERAGWQLKLELPDDDPDLPRKRRSRSIASSRKPSTTPPSTRRATTVRISLVERSRGMRGRDRGRRRGLRPAQRAGKGLRADRHEAARGAARRPVLRQQPARERARWCGSPCRCGRRPRRGMRHARRAGRRSEGEVSFG